MFGDVSDTFLSLSRPCMLSCLVFLPLHLGHSVPLPSPHCCAAYHFLLVLIISTFLSITFLLLFSLFYLISSVNLNQLVSLSFSHLTLCGEKNRDATFHLNFCKI
ncbi:hypothetical protein AMECASPLE_023713 [Ameca splendens]|uniref:Uncharacterized protein n=1 Tax=Ameca splendens TaxID=208324 RepID=A0ABV0XT26_9TELE